MTAGDSTPERDGQTLVDRAKDAFFELIELEPDLRPSRLDDLCASDPRLRHAVIGLLEAHDAAGGFLRELPPGSDQERAARLPLPPGTRIGPYLLERVLGEGGFGVVYLAQQQEPIRREVAFKVLKLGMDTDKIVARFEVERQTLARMDHPGIAKVLDAGSTPRGRPYFAMEYVDGAPITEFCDQQSLSVRERLVLFERVCLAVQHAHQKGVIHRDLKPSNVLVKLVDGEAVPKVIDFGIAKATGGRLAEHTLTGERQVVGTPEYMAPEQAVPTKLGEPDIDTRADVYSLGVILYRLLAGQSPYGSTSFDVASPGAWRDAIRGGELPRPSSRVRGSGDPAITIATARRTTPERLERTLRSELDWIVLRAVEKDRARRYQSASAFADDVRRYLLDEPVDAGPPSARYRVTKFCVRHRAAVSSGATVFVLAVVAAVVSTRAAFVAERERLEAQRLQALAERQAYVANVFAAEAALQERDSLGARRRLDSTPPALRGWEWRYYESQIDASDGELHRPGTSPSTARFSPDGRIIAVGWDDGAVDLVDVADRRVLARRAGFGGVVNGLAWHRDGARLFVAASSAEFFCWGWHDDRITSIASHTDTVTALLVADDGDELVSASHDGTVRLWDPDTLAPRRVLDHGSRVDRLAVSPDGATIVSVAWDQTLAVWDRGSGARRGSARAARSTTEVTAEQRWPPAEIMAVEFAPSSQQFVSACRDGLVVVWNAADVTRRGEIAAHDDVVRDVAWSPDGTRIALACRDGTATLWDAETLRPIATLPHGADVRSVAFDPRSELLATSSWDRAVRLFDARRGIAVDAMLGHADGIYSVAFDRDGTELATRSLDGSIRFWSRREASIALRQAHGSGVYTLAVGPGPLLVTGEIGGPALVWNTDTGRKTAGPLEHGTGIHAVAISRDGARVATGTGGGGVRLWDTATGRAIRDLSGHRDRVVCLAFDPTGTRLASGSRDETVRLWDLATGQQERSLVGHVDEVIDLALLPERDELVSCGEDGTVRIWNLTSGAPRVVRDLRAGLLPSLAVSPDRTRIAVGTAARTIHVLDARSLETLSVLSGHAERITGLAWLPDGSRLVSGAADRMLKLWDPATGEAVATLRGHSRQVQCVGVSDDGDRIFSGSEDFTVRLWEAPR